MLFPILQFEIESQSNRTKFLKKYLYSMQMAEKFDIATFYEAGVFQDADIRVPRHVHATHAPQTERPL